MAEHVKHHELADGDPRIVYAVMHGEYSSKRMLGLFSTPELAQEEIARREWGNEDDYHKCRIEEYQIDFSPPIPPGTFPFHVQIEKGGRVILVERENFDYIAEWEDYKLREDYVTRDSGYPQHLSAYMFASDEQHAAKIANERRTMLIGSGQWPEVEPAPIPKSEHPRLDRRMAQLKG